MTVDFSVDTQSYYPIPVRALFISDVHLGTPHSKAEDLSHFLKRYDAEQIYLVGDIIDFWHFHRTKMYWPDSHTRVLLELSRLAQTKKVWYIPGNHDEDLRVFDGANIQGINIINKTCHTTVKGRRYLVTHGDEFDSVIKKAKWLAVIGDRLYEFAMFFNGIFLALQKFFHVPRWSFSAWCKYRAKMAVQFVSRYESAVAEAVRQFDYDGLICGHIHCAANKHIIADIHYLNCGDWVESCTAIIENMDGEFEIVDY